MYIACVSDKETFRLQPANTEYAREIYTIYCNTAHELKGIGTKNKCIWIGNVIKFIISKSFHPKRYTHGYEKEVSGGKSQMRVAVRRV
jgi:hypothetical protein